MTIPTIKEYFEQGQLEMAIASAAEQVREKPSDAMARVLLVELQCVKGEFERADSQLNTLMSLKPNIALVLSTWRQLLRAAQIRADVFELKAKPELIADATDSVRTSMELLLAIKNNDVEQIDKQVKSVDTRVHNTEFFVNDNAPVTLRDMDDVGAYIFEILGTNGKYFWIDQSQVVSIELEKPTRILETLWRKARIILTNGTEGEVYLPSTYPLSSEGAACQGKKTQWQQTGSLYQGLGLKVWLAGDDELTFNDIRTMKNASHLNERHAVNVNEKVGEV